MGEGSGAVGADEVDAMREAASPPPPLLGQLPAAAPSPDAGMLWEVGPPMGISPALPFLSMLHGGAAGIPPPPATTLQMPAHSGGLALSGEGLAGSGGGTGSRKSPRLSPALQAQASPGALLRLDVSDVWFGEAGGAGAGSMFPALADLFKDPHGSAGLSL
jgi:hypothetical protein